MLHDKKVEIIESEESENQSNIINLALDRGNNYPNSNLREQYVREKEAIEAEFGSLEEMRLKIGLSRRKMCQLLLVDPSAWTRWTKSSEGAPPHVYQSLKWYLQLTTANPELKTTSANLESKVHQISATYDNQFKSLAGELQMLKNELTFKDGIVGALGEQLSNTISKSLTQIQVQIQTQAAPVQSQMSTESHINVDAIKETIKAEQFRNQTQINALEHTLMSLRNEISNLRNQTLSNQTVVAQVVAQKVKAAPAQTPSYYADENSSYQETTNKFLMGLIAVSLLSGIAYAFIKFF